MPQPFNYNTQPVNALGAYRAGQEQRQQDDQQAALQQYLPQAIQGDTGAIGSLAATGGQNLNLMGPLLAHAQSLGEQQRKDAENDAVSISTAFRGYDPATATPQETEQRRQAAAAALTPAASKAFLSLPPDQIPAALQRAQYMPAAIQAAQAAEDRNLKNQLTIAQTRKANAEGVKAATEKPDQYGNPIMADFRQPDGSVNTVLAQQDKKTGQWVSADNVRTPLGTPESLTPTGSASRFKAQAMRVQAAAQDTLNTVRAINTLPITASTGPLGLATAKTSFIGAPLNYLRQVMNPQDVQSYNVLAQGLAMNIATVEAQGLAPNDVLVNQANARLLVQPGDTYQTRLQKMAALRQHAEGHLEPMLHSDLVSPEEKNYIRGLLADMKKEIPYSPGDVIGLSAAPGQMTFKDYARRRGFKPPDVEGAATQPAGQNGVVQEYVPGGPAAGAQPPAGNVIRYDAQGNRIR